MKLNTFVKKENGLIKEMQTSYEESITDWEKIPNADDLAELEGEALTNAMTLISELDAWENKTGEYAPENLMTYAQKRMQSIAQGGYGSWNEQMEMMNEQGFEAWQAHCAAVKARFPK
jgi:hypothetical protein